jgi:Putative  PD-(D/E)XK family member, (DUF4420)
VSFGPIWEELERVTPPGESGRVKRRIKPEANCDLFLALAKPANLRMVLMLVKASSLDGIDELPTARGVEARIARPGEDGSDASLELVLTDPRSADIFTALAADIADAVAAESSEPEAVAALIGRLGRWQRFLEEAGSEGLTPERQRGLYAELWLLRTYLVDAVGATSAVQAWTGPARASHDYQFGPCAFEVKGTAAKQHQVLRIVSERQLDDTGVETLFLFHLSLDAHRDTGESLPALVGDVREALHGTAGATVLEDGLFGAGYLDAHRHLYENPGYTVRESNFFRVAEGFPRIVETDLVPGVGDVHYSVAVAECKHFLVDADTVIEEVKASHVGS